MASAGIDEPLTDEQLQNAAVGEVLQETDVPFAGR